LFKNKQKKERINELNTCLSFLRGLLIDKNQQLTNLTDERNNIQQELNQKNEEITQLRDSITRIEAEKNRSPPITLQRWNYTQNESNNRQTQINRLNSQLNTARNQANRIPELERQISKLNDEINNRYSKECFGKEVEEKVRSEIDSKIKKADEIYQFLSNNHYRSTWNANDWNRIRQLAHEIRCCRQY